jgi:hypothetical protein
MEFANIESLDFVLPFGSAVIATSIGTPKRYATCVEQQLLFGFCSHEINQRLRELFRDVTKGEHARAAQLVNT